MKKNQAKTFRRVRFFESPRAAMRAVNTEICREYTGQGLKFNVTEATADVVPAELIDTDKWVVQLIDRASGEPKGVVTELAKYGVSFDKPVQGEHRESSEQVVRKDGEIVGLIECLYDMDYEHPTSRNLVRKGTEEYVLTFSKGHPFDNCDFVFAVETGVEEYSDEDGYYRMVFPTARKALAAAKRFAKAVTP